MSAPTITALPSAPTRLDNAKTFTAKADAFVAALGQFVTQTNAVAEFVDERVDELDTGGASAAEAAASAAAAAGSASTAAFEASAAAAAAISVGGYYASLAAGVAGTSVGELFVSDASGTLALYKHIVGAPYYQFVCLVGNDDVNVRAFGAVGSGAVDDAAAVDAAISYASSINGKLIFPSGTYKISSDVTAPVNVTLCFRYGASISIDSGKKFFANGPIEARSKIFSGAGAVKFNEGVMPILAIWSD